MTWHPSQLQLDALHLGALDPAARGTTVQHLEVCASCRVRVQIAEADRRHFVTSVLPRWQAPKRRWAWLAVPVLALAALVLVVVTREPALGIKGGATLQVFAKHGERVVQLRDGMRVQPGDAIRFVVVGGARQHAAIVSIDGAGRTTTYYPYGSVTSVKLPDVPVLEVPGSIVLDDTIGSERLYLIVRPEPFRIETPEGGPTLRFEKVAP